MHRLRIGYLPGAEKDILTLVERLGFARQFGLELEIVECLGVASMRYGIRNRSLDGGLQDSVEALMGHLSGAEEELVSIGLVRGNRIRIVVSDRIARLGGRTGRALADLLAGGKLLAPLKIATDSKISSAVLFLLEYANSLREGAVTPVIVPSESMDVALSSQMVDAYCSSLSMPQNCPGCTLEGVVGSPERREMAIMASRISLNEDRRAWIRLMAAMLKVQRVMNDPARRGAAVETLKASEGDDSRLMDSIENVFSSNDAEVYGDAGVFSNAMAGGIIRVSPQWKVVVMGRCRRLGIPESGTGKGSFFDRELHDEAEDYLGKKSA